MISAALYNIAKMINATLQWFSYKLDVQLQMTQSSCDISGVL